MTREEVVRLVSRAIAAIQFIYALVDITYLPERMLAVHHYGQPRQHHEQLPPPHATSDHGNQRRHWT